jgi:uncharacterized coiled-coil protein SlyX
MNDPDYIRILDNTIKSLEEKNQEQRLTIEASDLAIERLEQTVDSLTDQLRAFENYTK